MMTEEAKEIYKQAIADRGVPTRLDQAALRASAIPMPWKVEGFDGSDMGLSRVTTSRAGSAYERQLLAVAVA